MASVQRSAWSLRVRSLEHTASTACSWHRGIRKAFDAIWLQPGTHAKGQCGHCRVSFFNEKASSDNAGEKEAYTFMRQYAKDHSRSSARHPHVIDRTSVCLTSDGGNDSGSEHAIPSAQLQCAATRPTCVMHQMHQGLHTLTAGGITTSAATGAALSAGVSAAGAA